MSTKEERTALWEYYAKVSECLGKKIKRKIRLRIVRFLFIGSFIK